MIKGLDWEKVTDDVLADTLGWLRTERRIELDAQAKHTKRRQELDIEGVLLRDKIADSRQRVGEIDVLIAKCTRPVAP